MPRPSLAALLVAAAALAGALVVGAACTTLVGLGEPCDRDSDCNGAQCKNGFCDVALAGGEGEGEGASAAEGEGVAGEGEGTSVAGEGEGEGGGVVVGEGEGEGGIAAEAPPRSCLDLLNKHPGTPTGNYNLDIDGDGLADDLNGDGVVDLNDAIHCDMDRDGGGWTLAGAITDAQLVARLQAANPNDPPCPGDWQLVDHRADLGFIGCVRNQTSGGSRSARVPALFPYKDVMGSVTGIMFGDADAFFDIPNDAIDDGIDAAYADGVSVTTFPAQAAPRQHVFTFLASHPLPNQTNSECPCVGGPPAPAFVGTDFFCATASCKARDSNGNCTAALSENERFFDPSTPVWSNNEICSPPSHDGDFFLRDELFAQDAATDLEVRVMDDQASSDEDMAIVHMEIYIRE